jgi:hypothetical protein
MKTMPLRNNAKELSLAVETALQRQDSALRLLEHLRADQPLTERPRQPGGGGRRAFRRWPAPETLQIDLHDGKTWLAVECQNIGVGGASISHLGPSLGDGPFAARLTTPDSGATLVLADVVWRDIKTGTLGVRFEFLDEEERDLWASGLIEALLAERTLK